MKNVYQEGYSLMVHSGGTKFYEAMLLVDSTTGVGAVVRRWGKTSSVDKGGEFMVEGMPETVAAKEYEKLVASKQKRGYERASSVPDNWRNHLSFVTGKDNVSQVLEVFGGDYGDDLVEVAPVAPSPKKPEPDRGSDWGSW